MCVSVSQIPVDEIVGDNESVGEMRIQMYNRYTDRLMDYVNKRSGVFC